MQLTLRCHYQWIIQNQDPETNVCFSNQEGYRRKLQTGLTFQS